MRHRRAARRPSLTSLARHERPFPLLQAYQEIMPIWVVDGWAGLPCPVCGQPVYDWHDAMRYAATYTASLADNWGLHYPACCDPPVVMPAHASGPIPFPAGAASTVEAAVEAAYRLDDEEVPFPKNPETGARSISSADVAAWFPYASLWYPIEPDDDASPAEVVKITDRIWSHSHPGMRGWTRRQWPGEFPDEIPLDVAVLVHCINLDLRVRMPLWPRV